MCMGFGCNAAGVTGCRIIDSPRERLIAILTNSLVPCNGRFPTILAVLTMFFAAGTGLFTSLSLALLLAATILLGIFMTFFSSWLLSKTVLKGVPSSFRLVGFSLSPLCGPLTGKSTGKRAKKAGKILWGEGEDGELGALSPAKVPKWVGKEWTSFCGGGADAEKRGKKGGPALDSLAGRRREGAAKTTKSTKNDRWGWATF